MAWLMFAGALACFALAILLPVGTPLVLLQLLAALVLLVSGTSHLLHQRLLGVSRSHAQMLDAPEMQRLCEQIATRQETPAPEPR